jgi:hypothetical protein
MTLWKIYTMEDDFPGLWQQWYRQQCVAVGFAPCWGHFLHGETEDHGGWRRGRNALLEIEVGDYVVAALKGNRVGRLGTVIDKRIEDDEWDPLVPKSKGNPTGAGEHPTTSRLHETAPKGNPAQRYPRHSRAWWGSQTSFGCRSGGVVASACGSRSISPASGLRRRFRWLTSRCNRPRPVQGLL